MSTKDQNLRKRRLRQRFNLLWFGHCTLFYNGNWTATSSTFYKRIKPRRKGLALDLMPPGRNDLDRNFSDYTRIASFHSLSSELATHIIPRAIKKALAYLNLYGPVLKMKPKYWSLSANEKTALWTALGTLFLTAVGFNNVLLSILIGLAIFVLFFEFVMEKR